MTELKTKIGLEIHVQLKTKSKMFCGCDNNAEGKAPNSVICPVCLGLPGSLPVANRQAIEWTIKTGLALNCEIPKIAKFDRKHYFYPDLPKGYQISQYDEPFCIGGSLKLKVESGKSKVEEEVTIRLTRIHLEEDAGKLIHKNGKSLVDLNRAGTPLMEIVGEPDITSPKMAGDFLRKLQKVVRDQVEVSDADMEKGHLRCDANISVSEMEELPHSAEASRDVEPKVLRMSQIIEIKNINSFKFVEKALTLVEEKLKAEYQEWPEGSSKETWGYDSVNNKVYLQRHKEEAADYRYFPEPDLPPFDSTKLNLEGLKSDTKESQDEKLKRLERLELSGQYVTILLSDPDKYESFILLNSKTDEKYPAKAAKLVIEFVDSIDLAKVDELTKIISADHDFQKSILAKIIELINSGKSAGEAIKAVEGNLLDSEKIGGIVAKIIEENAAELARYKAGQKQLFGFFMGQAIKETNNSANPQELSRILREKLEKL